MKPWTPGPVTGPLDELVHVSRLIGSDPSLVLHSGGNTSLKAMHHDVYGEPRDALYVKGTGLGLATIDSTGFAKLDLAMVRRLLTLGELSDHDMVDELRRAMLDTSGPPPSLETILHAFLPQRVVLHTHADAFLAISNSPDGDSVLEGIYGRSAVRVGYRRPGLPLARACAAAWEEQADASTITLLLERHGVFTFGDTVEQAYGRMVDVIDAAEKRLGSAPVVISDVGTVTAQAPPAELARLRAEVSNVAGRPLVMTRTCTPSLLELTGRVGLADLVERGPVTPDHVIRTKPAPMVGRDVDGYREAYERRFEHLAVQRDGDDLVMLDPAPRVVLDPDWGL
ncbi:MAG: class II aldolase/adducin family protein, partial [Acidimicrobiales bacterium]